jgi:hypothetical protein
VRFSRVSSPSLHQNFLTGYKLRKHIAKALSARSQAIRTALDRYNDAAAAMRPKRRLLSWENVVEYAFLADFDLLRDTREDITTKPWAKPASRLVSDSFFKMERAKEEITRLNVEIQRVITYMRDEERFLRRKEIEIKCDDPSLAHQIHLIRMERGRFTDIHMARFIKLARNTGFNGSIIPGISIDRSLHEGEEERMEVDEVEADSVGSALGSAMPPDGPSDGGSEDEQEDEQEDEELLVEKFNVLALTVD